MPTYTAAPIQVEAVQYQAPVAKLDADGLAKGTPGNQADIEALGVTAKHQTPWDPTTGQTCLLLDGIGLLQTGDYLVRHAAGQLEIVDAEAFEATYQVAEQPAGQAASDKKPKPDQS